MLKKYIQKKLERYVKKYFLKHSEVKLVVVVGSVGKTSTKRAIADILSQRYRIRMHDGNHNTELAAPLAILGIEYPQNVHSFTQWLSVFHTARKHIRRPTDVDVIIQELGVDHPGDMTGFSKYLNPDIALVTAITPEHMEFFGTIEAVAQEEMFVSSFSKLVLINRDDVEGRFAVLENNSNFATYVTSGLAEYRFEQQDFLVESGYSGTIISPETTDGMAVTIKVVGEHSLRPIIGAVAVAKKLGLSSDEIIKGMALIKPVPGRMNILRGIGGTTIIDDTYNSSPAAASAALQTLYTFSQASQRIAILGDMNELGDTSQLEHEKLGSICDPGLLSWVVTVGTQTEKFLAPVARQRGCQVKVVKNAIEAGEFVRTVTEEGAVILAKGSQSGVYLEEAVKILCDLTEDDELVRQSSDWMDIKDRYFSKFN